MELGVFGGTFNPVHLGHLRAAEEAREALGLERVVFVPAKIPPHKEARAVAPSDVRLDLVRRAVGDNPAFDVSELELRRDGPSYSVDTLRELRAGLGPGDRLWFLVGSDAYREIHTWSRYAELFALADVGVLSRPPGELRAAPPARLEGDFTFEGCVLRHRSGREVRFVPVTLLDISATAVRQALARGSSVRYLVPEAVREDLERLARGHPLWFSGSTA
ncbi:MAG: nicotinate-nucleotide adenylyltransferase [Deferrisomatales bacterium]